VFTRFGDYISYIDQAKAGDHVTLFDLDSLTSLAFLRSGAVDSTDGPELTVPSGSCCASGPEAARKSLLCTGDPQHQVARWRPNSSK
jgi:hypothetical protein